MFKIPRGWRLVRDLAEPVQASANQERHPGHPNASPQPVKAAPAENRTVQPKSADQSYDEHHARNEGFYCLAGCVDHTCQLQRCVVRHKVLLSLS